MRIRSIKPEFWRSQDISRLVIEDRLLFIGLWSYVDDNGVGEDRVPMIAADLFADDIERDPSETFARVSRGLARLSEGGQIIRYTVAGRDYFEILRWKDHQRIDKPGKARLPHHDADRSTIREYSRHSRDTLAPGSGNREQGTGDQGTVIPAIPSLDLEQLFDDAYSHWPKKVERKKSLEKFKQVCKQRDPHEVVSDVQRFGDAYAVAVDDVQFVPALNVWLNGERWTDDLPQPRQSHLKPVTSRADEANDFIRRLEAIDAVSGGGEAPGHRQELR